eukprot:6958089-Pyramimonas_sp.AAC.1
MYMFGFGLAANRCRRGEWMFGWPTRWVKLLVDEASRKSVLDDFAEDQRVWELFRVAPCTSDAMAKVKARHQFNLVENMQYMEGWKELGLGAGIDGNDALTQLTRERSRLPWSSLVSEETIGSMKNQKARGNRKYRKIETVFGNAIRGE